MLGLHFVPEIKYYVNIYETFRRYTHTYTYTHTISKLSITTKKRKIPQGSYLRKRHTLSRCFGAYRHAGQNRAAPQICKEKAGVVHGRAPGEDSSVPWLCIFINKPS